MKIFTINKILLAVVCTVLTTVLHAQVLTIATASNFREPMLEIVEMFQHENPTIEVKTIFGSSGNLYNQITNNAPFDLFFSANIKYPQKLYESGVSCDKPKIYAIGQLVVWSRKIDLKEGISMLKDSQIRRIAIANPELAPYGLGAKQYLKHFGLWDALKSKIVTAENIAQTAQFAVTGNADVAFLAKSQLNMKSIIGKGYHLELDTSNYQPIEQAFVCIINDDNEALTKRFVAFMNKAEIEQLIKSYGYLTDLHE